MKDKPTLTVAIAAYNEEANIGYLITDMLKQKSVTYSLDNLLIISDGSTDKTAEIVKALQKAHQKIILIENPERKGKSERMNDINKICHSDILVVLDADILTRDDSFLDKLIQPIISHGCDMTSATQKEIKPTNIMGKILFAGATFKETIYQLINNGDNIYTCHGHSRAFSKKLYKNMRYTTGVGEDAYSYLYCIFNQYKYCFAKEAVVEYKLPENFGDHKNQSIRYFRSIERLKKEFGAEFVEHCYKIPTKILVQNAFSALIKFPITLPLYFLIVIYMRVQSLFTDIPATWVMSYSTKDLRSSR